MNLDAADLHTQKLKVVVFGSEWQLKLFVKMKLGYSYFGICINFVTIVKCFNEKLSKPPFLKSFPDS